MPKSSSSPKFPTQNKRGIQGIEVIRIIKSPSPPLKIKVTHQVGRMNISNEYIVSLHYHQLESKGEAIGR